MWQLLDRLSGPGRRIILGLGLLTVAMLRLLLLLDRRHIFHDKGKSFRLVLMPQMFGDVVVDTGHPLRPRFSFAHGGVYGLGCAARLKHKEHTFKHLMRLGVKKKE